MLLKLIFIVHIEVNGFEKLFLTVLTHQVEERAFSIKISQLRAHDRLAPAGCLQYFESSEGIIKSFNYDDDYSKFPYRNPSYFVSLKLYHNNFTLGMLKIFKFS